MVTITRPSTSRPSGLLSAALLVLTLTLSACSFPLPVATPIASSSEAPAAQTPSSNPSADISASPEPTSGSSSGTGGVYGEFTSLSEACISVSATMLSVTILPLAALVGGKSEDIEKAKQELSQMQGKVPEELKPSFEKLRAFTEAAGTDFSKYGEPEFEELMKPIQDWMDKNCK
ncbi:hypothetical protein ACFRJ9_13350 [Paenarthrobacter sp. NPDC056912]|uniref:hypothetical protein n=1 Tax=Paenarthrobacter sp. NPDC056912 TaxID=3345965 RepID=UPI0036709D07